MKKSVFAPLVLVPVAALALAGCSGSSGDASASSSAQSDGITIVASTNAYGDIAEQVAGDGAEVTSLITSSTQDPHEYEATAQDKLAVQNADIIIENGAGFDHFVDTLIDDTGSSAVVLNASEISGLLPSGADANSDEEIEGFNEHMWYNFDTVTAVADDLAKELGSLDEDNASTYTKNAEAFDGQLSDLSDQLADLAKDHTGEGVAVTEPVPLYLLEAAGLENKTPDEFTEAIEEGDDVSPTVLQEVIDLVSSDEVVLLGYNEQTSDDTTEQVKSAAEDAGLPVISFTETLPEGDSYIQWMTDNVNAVADALS